MVGIAGLALTPEERDLLRHPAIGGVILFKRNFVDPEQVTALTGEIHALREPRLLVAVDQEGGRVQRFREGFVRLPPVRRLGESFDKDAKRAKHLAQLTGWLMAAELRAVGADLSFAPVLDLDRGTSAVIGDRAFHSDPEAVAELAHAYMAGMALAGMAATGKHFPGHGTAVADSHVAVAVDEREYADIAAEDLLPFERMVHYGLAAVMAAHVIYPRVDPHPAGFSRFWLQEVLRHRLGFQGVIFSDDLGMEGASLAGDAVGRVRAALDAGCDMALLCNDLAVIPRVLDSLGEIKNPASALRFARLHGRGHLEYGRLRLDEIWHEAARAIEDYGGPEPLNLV